jgi:hypothetical protein
MSEYEAQANEFLNKFGLSFKAAWKGGDAPAWAKDGRPHGDKYRVTIKRKGGRSVSFDFWNSFHDTQLGIPPTAYGVLACISGDIHCPDTFEDFCDEYCYDEDSRNAERIFKAASAFMRKLRAFFTEDEIEALSEIR